MKVMAMKDQAGQLGVTATFDLAALAKKFPETAATMLLDMRLTDEFAASARLFRIYAAVPPHYHQSCDEYLLLISGRTIAVVGDSAPQKLNPGQLLFFRRGVVHSFPEILEHPLVVLAVDTPRRDPADVTFVDADAGTIGAFLQTVKAY